MGRSKRGTDNSTYPLVPPFPSDGLQNLDDDSYRFNPVKFDRRGFNFFATCPVGFSWGIQEQREIDDRQNEVKPGNWKNEFDRPIFFVELRDGYACSLCELDGNQLLLIPCPQSRGQIPQVRYPAEADIVGRVTAVTMRIAEGGQSRV